VPHRKPVPPLRNQEKFYTNIRNVQNFALITKYVVRIVTTIILRDNNIPTYKHRVIQTFRAMNLKLQITLISAPRGSFNP
jgi:isocitrate/isopropylmalate dehydrogenase